ncbi:hypothetical protein BOX15_Mlig026511g2 [Macrostomum lignano]|uniref:Ubiquitin-like domain-containing protein n=1 Tax=Macrostomum lignano TaxID=282301 RepID=A0A267D9C6_9PLAT|nr:hypothetical protein BOX15_Mlig026511g2 [Macrostomum lignano]
MASKAAVGKVDKHINLEIRRKKRYESGDEHDNYKQRYKDPTEFVRIRAPPPEQDGVVFTDPVSWDIHYANRRKAIQSETHKLLKAIKEDQKAPAIDLSRHELMPERNNWLTELEKQAAGEVRPLTPQFMRKVIATFYTWEERRIYLHVWRSDFDYEHIKQMVTKGAPYTSNDIEVLAVLVGTNQIERFRADHIKHDTKLFLICCPTLFVLRVRLKGMNDLMVSTSPLETVHQLKRQIYQRKCYPMHRFDLLFTGSCMENSERLFHYDLRDGSIVNMFLQTGCYMRVKVTTFWKKVYELEIDQTASAQHILTMVIKNCMSPYVGEYFIVENYIRPRFLTLHSPGHYYFGLDEGVYRILLEEQTEHLVVSMTESAHKVTLEVRNCPEGVEYVKCDAEGHYGVGYMNLHGLTGIPVDMMILKIPGKTLNPYDGVHEREDGKVVELKLSSKGDLFPKNMPINIVMRSGAIQQIRLNMRHEVTDLQLEIQRMGYNDPTKYNLYHKGKLIPKEATLLDAEIEANSYVHVCAHYYPIDVVNVRGYKKVIKVQCTGKVSRLYLKANEAFPPQYGKAKYIFAGEDIFRAKRLDHLELWPGCAIFQETIDPYIVVQVVYKAETIILELNSDDFTFLVRDRFTLWELPTSTLDSLEQLLVWLVTKPSYTESRPAAKPIKITEELIDNPAEKPEIDWQKLRPPPPTAKPFRLGRKSPRAGVAISLPPVKLYEVARPQQLEKDEGVQTLLKEEKRHIGAAKRK